jgi:DNA primase
MIPSKPDILAVMEREGVELRQRGRDYWGRCPFHADKTPSFKVSLERQAFYCFGCGVHGDVLTFIQKHHGITFNEALKTLGLHPGRPIAPNPVITRRRDLLKAFESWRRYYRQELSYESIRIHSLLYAARKRKTPLPEGLGFLVAAEQAKLPMIEHQLDILFSGDDEAVFHLYEDIR